MSRNINELLPEILVSASGCPSFLALQYLSSAVREFLEATDVWKAWAPAVDVVQDQATYTFQHNLADPLQVWVRTKTIDMLQWAPTGKDLDFKTAQQLQAADPLWRTRKAARPAAWTYEIDGGTGIKLVRIYPTPSVAVVGGLLARLVLTTHTYTGLGVTANDTQAVLLPDEIFQKYRDTFVCGALARLYAVPRRDWTDYKAATYHRGMFEDAKVSAKSAGDVDHGDAVLVVDYGGL